MSKSGVDLSVTPQETDSYVGLDRFACVTRSGFRFDMTLVMLAKPFRLNGVLYAAGVVNNLNDEVTLIKTTEEARRRWEERIDELILQCD